MLECAIYPLFRCDYSRAQPRFWWLADSEAKFPEFRKHFGGRFAVRYQDLDGSGWSDSVQGDLAQFGMVGQHNSTLGMFNSQAMGQRFQLIRAGQAMLRTQSGHADEGFRGVDLFETLFSQRAHQGEEIRQQQAADHGQRHVLQSVQFHGNVERVSNNRQRLKLSLADGVSEMRGRGAGRKRDSVTRLDHAQRQAGNLRLFLTLPAHILLTLDRRHTSYMPGRQWA